MRVAVVVLGDVGRSPRMQYHAKSLGDLTENMSKAGSIVGKVFAQVQDPKADTSGVSLVGYTGEPCVPEVEEHPRITQYRFSPYETALPKAFFPLYAPLKVLVLLWRLSYVLLFEMPRPDAILVQNPPSIPALLLVWITVRLYGAKMIIDWHNFGFTVLGQSRGKMHPFAVLSRIYEQKFAVRADASFCVTKAMKEWLEKHWGVQSVVLYDKAPDFFHETTVQERHELFGRLSPQFEAAWDALEGEKAAKEEKKGTLFTTSEGKLRDDRPALVVSSTSWTEDEDFSLLLGAVEALDKRIKDDKAFPNVLVVVTGKGPQKAMYEERMAKLELKKVHICTMWLEPKDYPLLLGSADLGVCLHTSTSGLDLPMKVVDMFGCGLPVCAVKFDCLDELVQHEKNGLVFSSSDELTDNLAELLCGCTSESGNAKLKKLREGVAGFGRWQSNWSQNASQAFRRQNWAQWQIQLRVSAILIALAALIGMLIFIQATRGTNATVSSLVALVATGAICQR